MDKGFTEEIFLAIMTEGRDRPRLSENQTLLSPVVLVGPPRLSFKKPVVLSFGHCANLKLGSWELGVYHCDSLFSDTDDTPWVKLVTVGQESLATPILASMDFEKCFIMTDFLTRFCIVGQSGLEGNASKVLRLLIFGKVISSSLDFSLCIQVIDDTPSALERVLRVAKKQGFGLMDKPKSLFFQDGGADLHLTIGECTTGWSLKPKNLQKISFHEIWSSTSSSSSSTSSSSTSSSLGSNPHLRINYSLQHIDPTVSLIAFKLSAFQSGHPETCQSFSVNVDSTEGSCFIPFPAAYESLSSRAGSLLSSNGGGGGGGGGQILCHADSTSKLPSSLKKRLCQLLDNPHTMGQNDWRALAAGLRMERFNQFFETRGSPTDGILTLWEVQKGEDPGAITDLLNLLRVIGRHDCASMIESEYGPWI